MGVFRQDPQGAAEREQMKRERQQARADERARQEQQRAWDAFWEAFWATPQGQARVARTAGRRFSQVALPLEETVRTWTRSQRTTQQEPTGLPEAIEAEGWSLF
jgi:hypothetical protein